MNRHQRRANEAAKRKDAALRNYVGRLLQRVKNHSMLAPTTVQELNAEMQSNATRLHRQGVLTDREYRDFKRFHSLKRAIEAREAAEAAERVKAAKLAAAGPEGDRFA